MQETGEELIDLNESNPSHNKENDSNKKEKNNLNNRCIFILLTIILFSIIAIAIYLYSNPIKLKKQYKSVIIFDFDKTITEKDTFEEQRYLIKSKEAQDELVKRVNSPENWATVMNETYEQYNNLNISISDINTYIDKVSLTKGMSDLINYLYNNKNNKYILVILSAGHLYQINRVLQKNNLNFFFGEIVSFNSYEKNGRIIVEKNEEYICDKCIGIGQCKTKEFNLLKNKYEKKNIFFDKIYYICDGVNDFCLARNLKSDDELLIRNNFTLDKYLYQDGFVKYIKSNINKWNNGFDIIKFFQNII